MVAQWSCLCVPTLRPTFESHAQFLSFIDYITKIDAIFVIGMWKEQMGADLSIFKISFVEVFHKKLTRKWVKCELYKLRLTCEASEDSCVSTETGNFLIIYTATVCHNLMRKMQCMWLSLQFRFFKKGPIPASFVYFHSFKIPIQMLNIQFEQYNLKKVYMVCLRLEPRAAGWKPQTNPLSYGSTPSLKFFTF